MTDATPTHVISRGLALPQCYLLLHVGPGLYRLFTNSPTKVNGNTRLVLSRIAKL